MSTDDHLNEPTPQHECHTLVHKTTINGKRTWACGVWNSKTNKNFRIAFDDTESAVEFANYLQDVIGVGWTVEHAPQGKRQSE